MNVVVSASSRPDISERAVREFASLVLAREHVDDDASLSISFVDEREMAELNADHMGRSGPTDVLSFPIEDASPGRPPVRDLDGPPLQLGDVFICGDVVEGHAVEYGVSFHGELYLMIVHGVLHILGWDHQTAMESEAMEAREAEHLAEIGVDRR